MTRRFSAITAIAILWSATAGPVLAASIEEAELMNAATDLAHRYDTHYAAKDPAAIAALYAPDGILVSPAGPVVRGREALLAYYTKRFASGAFGHAIKVGEVHVQGEGGYSIAQFSVTVPRANGELREEHGNIVAVYQRNAEGWHMRLVEPSVPEAASK